MTEIVDNRIVVIYRFLEIPYRFIVVERSKIAVIFGRESGIFRIFPVQVDEVIEIVGRHVFPDRFGRSRQGRVSVQQVPFARVRAFFHFFRFRIILLHVQIAERSFCPVFGSSLHKAQYIEWVQAEQV